MYSLSLDTSTEKGAFALFSNQEPIFSCLLPSGFQTAQALLPALELELKKASFDLSKLKYIAVGAGPGSYTGIRVGVTVAKSLAFVKKIPLVGICSLDAFLPTVEGDFAAIIDAKIGGVYMQLGRFDGKDYSALTEPKVYALSDAIELLKNVHLIVTPNALKIQPKFLSLGLNPQIPWEESYPSCRRLSVLGYKKIQESKDLKFEVMYLQRTQAEIERNRS